MSEAYAKVMEREARAAAKSHQIAQMLAENALTLDDLMGGTTTTVNKVALTEGDIYAGLTPEERAELRASMLVEQDVYTHQPGSQALNEANPAPKQRRQAPQALTETAPAPKAAGGGSWSTTQLNAKLKSGAVVPVWKVTDAKTGMEMPTPFRIQEVADRIAAILNESGNVNHPSIVSTVNAYNKRIAIVKEMKQVKDMIAEGQVAKKSRLQQLQGELAALDMKLGI